MKKPSICIFSEFLNFLYFVYFPIIVFLCSSIPDICYFCNTDKIFGAKILHRKVRKFRKIRFCDKIAYVVVNWDTNYRS